MYNILTSKMKSFITPKKSDLWACLSCINFCSLICRFLNVLQNLILYIYNLSASIVLA